MEVLIINSGSSSLKFSVIETENEKVKAEGICERIGISDPLFTMKNYVKDKEIKKESADLNDHSIALDYVLNKLCDKEFGIFDNINSIDAVGHRVVHGGPEFKESVLVDDNILTKVEEISHLAPLHNPANIIGVKLARKLLPGKPNVLVFDTAFHQTMESHIYTYPIPYEDYEELKIRKYGFHGTSHKYVAQVTHDYLGKEESKIIICHIGNGGSLSAVKNGKTVVDTSMGLTPLAGIMMGTRCGDIDPAIPLYIQKERKMTLAEVDDRLNKKSGVLGIYKKSSDLRDLEDSFKAGDEKAILALEMYCNRIRNYIGSYIVTLGGVDAIVFTAGVGENSVTVREKVCENLEFLGIDFDFEKNEERIPGIVEYSKPESKVKILKVPTNEELMIARDTESLCK